MMGDQQPAALQQLSTRMCRILQSGMAALAVRLLTFRRWNDEMPYARPFFVAFGILVAELYIENFFIW